MYVLIAFQEYEETTHNILVKVKPLKAIVKVIKKELSPHESLAIPLLIAIYVKGIAFVNYHLI